MESRSKSSIDTSRKKDKKYQDVKKSMGSSKNDITIPKIELEKLGINLGD